MTALRVTPHAVITRDGTTMAGGNHHNTRPEGAPPA